MTGKYEAKAGVSQAAQLSTMMKTFIDETKERILKKIPALIILAILFVWLIYASGARSFMQGCINTFLLWMVIKLYVVFVLDCGWLAHTPSAWIPGTEDMKECYQDYRFYMKSIPRSLIVGLIVAAMVLGKGCFAIHQSGKWYSEGDNPTIGIVLCSDTDEDIARYSVMYGNEQLFASNINSIC